MHTVLERQLNRAGLGAGSPPSDPGAWESLLAAVSTAYEQADQDRYLLERSLALSSEEMGELHRQLAAERDRVSAVICSLDEGVCAIDADGALLFINPEARRLLGLAPDTAIEDARLVDLVDAQSCDGTPLSELLVRPLPQSPEENPQEPCLVVGGNTATFIAYAITPLGEQGGGKVLTLRDISGRKRMEREREELNKRFMEVSRQAGMAEVASDVLHNVGNVLNSVNVSCSVAIETAKSSRSGNVAKLAELIGRHRDAPAAFFTSDPVGSKIPDYLGELGEQLESERRRLLAELGAVQQSTDHIREIVATQQSLAKLGGIREAEDLASLMEEALRVSEPSFRRHRVRVVREFTPTPLVRVERHQVLQIFINLVNNAKQAVSELETDRRLVTVRITPRHGRVVVEVADAGCGIPPENLTRIFSHGFTTREDGHGFGLHSAALAAKSMGATLSATSEGVGRGATFTLDLPTDDATKERAA